MVNYPIWLQLHSQVQTWKESWKCWGSQQVAVKGAGQRHGNANRTMPIDTDPVLSSVVSHVQIAWIARKMSCRIIGELLRTSNWIMHGEELPFLWSKSNNTRAKKEADFIELHFRQFRWRSVDVRPPVITEMHPNWLTFVQSIIKICTKTQSIFLKFLKIWP